MPPSTSEYLRHILDETRYLSLTSAGIDRENFLCDETLKRAFMRSIEIIGEAVKHSAGGIVSAACRCDVAGCHPGTLSPRLGLS